MRIATPARKTYLCAAALALALAIPALADASMSPASADDNDPVAAAVATYQDLAPELAAASTGVYTTSDTDSALLAAVGGDATKVDVPRSPSALIAVASQGNDPVAVQLPQLPDTEDARLAADGLAGFAAPSDHTTLLVQATSGGSVRFLVVAESTAAPTSYAFAIDTDREGSQLSLLPNGGVELRSPENIPVADITPPWAKDATGAALPAWYEVQGLELTLRFNATNASFPVVADPEIEPYNDPADPGWQNSTAPYVTGDVDPQCSVEVSSRSGGWMCPSGDTASQQSYQQQLVDSGEFSTATDAYCTGKGCWQRISGTRSSFSSIGRFGYGKQILGDVDVAYTVALNGAQAIVKPVKFRILPALAGVSIHDVGVNGDRLYYSAAYPGGHVAKRPNGTSNYDFYYVANYDPSSGTSLYAWPGDGYLSYQPSIQHSSVAIEWDWDVGGYPGSWYTFGKSVKFDKSSDSAATIPYTFGSSSYLGKSPVGGGYNAS